jgi:hypothetical protein
MDQCEESYKILFIKVFHILVYLTILNIQNVRLWTNTFQTFYPIFFVQRKIPMDYIKTKFSLLVTTLYLCLVCNGRLIFVFKAILIKKKNHFNVILLSIDHFSRKHDVVARFSLPQGENNQMVGFFLFIGIKFFIKIRWLLDCLFIKEMILLLKKR